MEARFGLWCIMLHSTNLSGANAFNILYVRTKPCIIYKCNNGIISKLLARWKFNESGNWSPCLFGLYAKKIIHHFQGGSMVMHQAVKSAVPGSNPATLQPAGTCNSLLGSQQGWHDNCRLASEGRQWQKKYKKNALISCIKISKPNGRRGYCANT